MQRLEKGASPIKTKLSAIKLGLYAVDGASHLSKVVADLINLSRNRVPAACELLSSHRTARIASVPRRTHSLLEPVPDTTQLLLNLLDATTQATHPLDAAQEMRSRIFKIDRKKLQITVELALLPLRNATDLRAAPRAGGPRSIRPSPCIREPVAVKAADPLTVENLDSILSGPIKEG